ncbi:MAG: hypothetical protein N2691_04685 [Patescibacteria group bacterium]|nr:hypothetical protein [Patescibacteria group bacterium]
MRKERGVLSGLEIYLLYQQPKLENGSRESSIFIPPRWLRNPILLRAIPARYSRVRTGTQIKEYLLGGKRVTRVVPVWEEIFPVFSSLYAGPGGAKVQVWTLNNPDFSEHLVYWGWYMKTPLIVAADVAVGEDLYGDLEIPEVCWRRLVFPQHDDML